MVIYFLLVVYYILIYQFEDKIKNDNLNRNILCIILVLPMFILVAFRSINIGIDTIVYYKAYQTIGYVDGIKTVLFSNSFMEKGYLIITYIFSRLGFEYYTFQVIEALFIYTSFGAMIRKYSSNMSMSCLIFVTMQRFFGTMNQARMWIAAAILFYSINLIQERKFIKFLVLVAIASSFHKSAMIFIIVYFIVRIPENYKKWVSLGLGALVIEILGISFLERLTSTIGMYENYVNTDRFSSNIKISILISLITVMGFFVIAIRTKMWASLSFEKLYKRIHVLSKYNFMNTKKQMTVSRILFNLLLLSICFNIIGLKSSIFGRVTVYFSVFAVVTIPDLISTVINNFNRNFIRFCVILYFVFMFIVALLYGGDGYGVIPYEFL